MQQIFYKEFEKHFLRENNCNFNSYKFSYKFVFIPSLSFRRNEKQELNFQQVGGLITRNISVFCLQRVALLLKYVPNSIDFYMFYMLFLLVVWFHAIHCVKSVRIRSYSDPYFPTLGLNAESYFVSLRIQSECGKIRNIITPNTDTFYAVILQVTTMSFDV